MYIMQGWICRLFGIVDSQELTVGIQHFCSNHLQSLAVAPPPLWFSDPVVLLVFHQGPQKRHGEMAVLHVSAQSHT